MTVLETMAPPIDPERAEALRRQLVGLATAVLDRAIAQLSEAPSTGSGSERLLFAVMRPQLPRIRLLLLSKLSEADPAGLELVLGATATAIESILWQAPGDALPRRRWDFDPAGRLVLVPYEQLEEAAAS